MRLSFVSPLSFRCMTKICKQFNDNFVLLHSTLFFNHSTGKDIVLPANFDKIKLKLVWPQSIQSSFGVILRDNEFMQKKIMIITQI